MLPVVDVDDPMAVSKEKVVANDFKKTLVTKCSIQDLGEVNCNQISINTPWRSESVRGLLAMCNGRGSTRAREDHRRQVQCSFDEGDAIIYPRLSVEDCSEQMD